MLGEHARPKPDHALMYFDAHYMVNVTSAATGKTVALTTVHSIHLKDDSKQIGSSCKLVVPLASRIQYQDGKHDFLTDLTKNLFKSGDAITVQCYYTGYPVLTIFQGFIYEFIEGTPMTIECLDNIYLLNQTTVNLSYSSISLRDLLTRILQGTGVTLMLPTLDLQLVDITFRLMSPASILQWFRTELGLNISLINNQLYCNIASNIVSTGILNSTRNVIAPRGLQKPEAVFLKLKVKCWFIQENGKKTSLEVGDEKGELREVFFYKIPFSIKRYTQLAGEALIKYKQMKFSGKVHTLLYPMIGLFWKVQYNDFRYPEENGNYTVVGREFKADEHGYHWQYEMAYLSDLDSAVDQLAGDNNLINLNP